MARRILVTPVHWVVSMLTLTLVIYGATAGAYLFAARPWMMITFVGYVIANVGFIWDALR